MHVALERNASAEAVLQFKRALVTGGLEVAVALNGRLPWLPVPDAARLLVRFHGAVVALRQMADPPPAVAEALAQPDLAILQVDLAADLRELVVDLLIAAHARRTEGDGVEGRADHGVLVGDRCGDGAAAARRGLAGGGDGAPRRRSRRA
ncbi:MAG: hypothetical protein R3F59_04275 [Myxococcota bacterium]